MKKFFKGSYFAIVMAFIYIPVVIMIIFSFNSGNTTFAFTGWDTKWYGEFINNSPFVKSIITSLFVAVISTAISLVIGTMAAIGLSRVKKTSQRAWFQVANIPLINADVVTAVSLMIVFILAGANFGIVTLIMAHVSFNVPYVLITVMPRLRKVDKAIIESAQDLGSKPSQVLFRVILPILKPAIISAAAISFAMSFDDFIISYFTGGSQTNVSTFIYTAKKVKPFIFAFGTILVAFIVGAIIGWNAFSIIKQSRLQTKEKIKSGTYKQKQIHKLEVEIDKLIDIIETEQKIKKTKRISLWAKYLIVKIKLKFVASRNYDKKITRLEWKRYKIKSEISKEKRYYTRRETTKKRLKKLNYQLSKTNTDVKKAAKLSIQIEKLEDKLEFLNGEIEYIENRDELSKQKAKEISKEIKKIKREFREEESPSKKTIAWYNKKIKSLEQWKIDVEEGKNNYKLRMVVERLKDIKEKNYNKVILLNEKLNYLYKLTHPQKSIVSSIDKKIINSNDENRVQLLEIRDQQLEKEINSVLLEVDIKLSKISKINMKIEKVKNKLMPPRDEDVNFSKGFFARSWKVILVSLVGVAAFAGLTVAYIKNNIYDLVIGNWGEYIDPELITEFEQKYNVRINYQEYDSNETLYNKLYTFNYDVMVPSDYMVQRLAEEGRLLKLDYSKLNIYGQNYNTSLVKDDESVEINSNLISTMEKSPVNIDGDSTSSTILDYSVPYFWGDLVMVINPTESNINFLKNNGVTVNEDGTIDESTISWSLLWDAANAGKKLVLNSDPKNIFMLGAEKHYQKVNVESKQEVDEVSSDVADLILNKNVSLNGDDLITKVSLGQFDFALMYNGDAVYANQTYNDAKNTDEHFLYARPEKNNETTNIFSDNMVISSNTKHQELAYAWINFIAQNMEDLSSYVGITSPSQTAIDNLTSANGDFYDYSDLYNVKQQNTDQALSFQYHGSVDDYLVDKYNNIYSGKH